MKNVLLAFAVGVLVPLAALFVLLVVFIQTSNAPVPAWISWSAQVVGYGYIYWRLRPRFLRALAYAVLYLLVFNFALFSGGLTIMQYLGGGGQTMTSTR